MAGRYLVTGGAGFIGSHLVEALLRRGEEVVVLDNFSTGRRDNLETAVRSAGGRRPTLIEGDIREPGVVHQAMVGVTHVLHQAALPSVQRSVEDPVASHGVNATATLGLLVAARDAGVRRFVYASSSSVYGDTPQQPKIETMPTTPRSPYAASKLTGEHYCRMFHPLYGLETVSLRYFNVFGPRQDPNSQYAAVIPNFIAAATHGRPPTVFGDGLQTRDFTYVENVVQANLLACEAPVEAVGRAYNVACGVSTSLLDLLLLLGPIVKATITPQHAAARPGDVRHSLAGIEEARTCLGFRPHVGLEEGLRRTVDWFRA